MQDLCVAQTNSHNRSFHTIHSPMPRDLGGSRSIRINQASLGLQTPGISSSDFI